MLLSRFGPEGEFCVRSGRHDPDFRRLSSDPWATAPRDWVLGEALRRPGFLRAPVEPRTVVGIGRSFAAHARELGNPVPDEPILFLKAASSVIGPGEAIVLPPESRRVEYEGEVAVVLRTTLRRGTATEAREASLGITAAVDVTARDIQRADVTFARGKSFDTFCPLGPEILVGGGGDDVRLETRVDGEVRQCATLAELTMPLWELVAWVSRFVTLGAGDVVLTGTPAGVGPLRAGQLVEVEVGGVGLLANPVLGGTA